MFVFGRLTQYGEVGRNKRFPRMGKREYEERADCVGKGVKGRKSNLTVFLGEKKETMFSLRGQVGVRRKEVLRRKWGEGEKKEPDRVLGREVERE